MSKDHDSAPHPQECLLYGLENYYSFRSFREVRQNRLLTSLNQQTFRTMSKFKWGSLITLQSSLSCFR